MLEQAIKDLALDRGAAAVGIAGGDRLKGPASMDPTYLLPGAKSIVSMMIPLDGGVIERYLGKEDHPAVQAHETEVYRKLYSIGEKIVALLESEGHRAHNPEPNLDYRFKDTEAYKRVPYSMRQGSIDRLTAKSGPAGRAVKKLLVKAFYSRSMKGTDWSLVPSFSHRYGAVAAGIANMGWSGNVLHPDCGARALYFTVLTDAELSSDPFMEDSPCDGCRTCVKVCQSGFMNMKEKAEVTIGGKTFTHNKKGHNLRCILVCAGFSGQNKHKGWSTWSPGRLDLPGDDREMPAWWERFAKDNAWRHNYYSHVMANLVFHTEYGFIRKPKDRFMTTCGFCQFVCAKTREERKDLYDLIVESGEVVEGPDFSFNVVRGGSVDTQRRVEIL